MSAGRLTAWLAALGYVTVGCGGGGPSDDTPPVQRTTIKWTLNEDLSRGFPGDACIDLGVSMVHVVLSGPTDPPDQIVDERCGNGQVVYLMQPNGSYSVAVTPLDVNGAPMIGAPVTVAFEVTGTNEQTINIPYTAWLTPYTGSYLFALTWAGSGCAQAVPAVATQVLTLLIGGNPVTQLTSTGQKLDGTDPKPCVTSTPTTPQLVSALPIGPATLIVRGLDGTGAEQYSGTFDTFVGAATNNPTANIDVPGPDAAPPDAALPDAAMPDAAPIDATLQ